MYALRYVCHFQFSPNSNVNNQYKIYDQLFTIFFILKIDSLQQCLEGKERPMLNMNYSFSTMIKLGKLHISLVENYHTLTTDQTSIQVTFWTCEIGFWYLDVCTIRKYNGKQLDFNSENGKFRHFNMEWASTVLI